MIEKIEPLRKDAPKVVIKEGATKEERKAAEMKVAHWKAAEAQRIGQKLDESKAINNVRFPFFLSSLCPPTSLLSFCPSLLARPGIDPSRSPTVRHSTRQGDHGRRQFVHQVAGFNHPFLSPFFPYFRFSFSRC
jgi:hypothetical protein